MEAGWLTMYLRGQHSTAQHSVAQCRSMQRSTG
jgi:hypothetical protein